MRLYIVCIIFSILFIALFLRVVLVPYDEDHKVILSDIPLVVNLDDNDTLNKFNLNSEVTIGFASHGRHEILRKAVDSAKLFNPGIPIVVVDDGEKNYNRLFNDVMYIKIDFDSGLSTSRNKIVSNTRTKYVFITDEDILFTKDSNLNGMVNYLKDNDDVWVVGGHLSRSKTYSTRFTFLKNGQVETCTNKKLDIKRGECVLSDRCLNLFVTTTQLLRENKWNETLKLGEHSEFFSRLKLKGIDTNSVHYTAECNAHKFIHKRNYERTRQYKLHRNRAVNYTKMLSFVEECSNTLLRVNFMHIPKTAGASFYSEMVGNGVLFTGISPGMNEKCFYFKGKKQFTMIREPYSHVLSQYKMCKFSSWGKTKTCYFPANDPLGYWLNNFSGCNCYHPNNMQVRFLTCSNKNIRGHLDIDGFKYNVKKAMKNLLSLKYGFGLTEFYTESVCLLIHNLGRRLPKWCFCSDNVKHSHETHNVSTQISISVNTVNRKKITELTNLDSILYEKAKAVFLDRVDKLKKTITC